MRPVDRYSIHDTRRDIEVATADDQEGAALAYRTIIGEDQRCLRVYAGGLDVTEKVHRIAVRQATQAVEREAAAG